jgi:hypothetical protein
MQGSRRDETATELLQHFHEVLNALADTSRRIVVVDSIGSHCHRR